MKFQTIIIFLIIVFTNLIKCDDVCDFSKNSCNDKETPCKWKDVCGQITSDSNINFNNKGSLYLQLDSPVVISSLILYETELSLTASFNGSFIIKNKLNIQEGGLLSINSINMNINDFNSIKGGFEADSSTIIIRDISNKNSSPFKIKNSSVYLSGKKIEFNTQPNFVDSYVEVVGNDDNCQFLEGIILENEKQQSLNKSRITFTDKCELFKNSKVSTIIQNGKEPIILNPSSTLLISGSLNCYNERKTCIKADEGSIITFNIDDSSNYNSNDLYLSISGIELWNNSKLQIGGDELDNDLKYNSVKLSNIYSSGEQSGIIYLSDISNLYQLSEINDDSSTTDIIIEDGTTTEIKKSKLHNLIVHSGGESKLSISDETAIYNGNIEVSNTVLEIGNGVTISNSQISANKGSLLKIKSNQTNMMKSRIISEESILLENTEIMILLNSSVTVLNNNNIISNNSYIQPTGSSNFTANQYYLNGNSKLEVDHSIQDSNFTIFGELIANEHSIIGLKQLGKLSPHLIVTGNLSAGGCTLEIVFDAGTEDLHAEYTILESNYFINNFNSIIVYNGNDLIDKDYYELQWRGKFCYLLNDVERDKDFVKTTIDGWTVMTVLAILAFVVLLFAFYKFYKNKFRKSDNKNKYEPLEMTDLEKI